MPRTRIIVLLVALISALIAAGCGGDDENGNGNTTLEPVGAEEEAALQEEISGLSDEEQIRRLGAAWAEPFAAGQEAMCAYLHPDIAGGCSQFVQGALTGSSILQNSYAGATVTKVTVDGNTALAEFSNGEPVEFGNDPDGEWKITAVRRAGSKQP
jgi:hypothetical protein